MTKDNGGPAFPREPIGEDCGRPYGHQDGMSLRDWFAGQALAGFATAIAETPINENPLWHKMADDAYAAADAMLAARKDTPDAD